MKKVLFAALAMLATAAIAEPIQVLRHMLTQQQNAPVLTYEQAVLTLLMDKTVDRYGPYQLVAAPRSSQDRAFVRLEEGQLDVTTSMTNRERENRSIPIRYCLYRGLLGVRLPIALESRVAALETKADDAQAGKLSVAQVFDWPDADILAANHWNLMRIDDFRSFPKMLLGGRFDLFSLGAIEVYPIVDPMRSEGIVVLNDWAITYPSAFYFFVSRRNPELAARLKLGFERALEDGSFIELFNRDIGPQLERAHLAQRKWVVLRNPTLPPETPLGDARLWHALVWERFGLGR